MKRAIITGPTGAIGIALIEELLKHDIEITAVCHRGSRRLSHLPKSQYVKVIECNIDEVSEQLPRMMSYDGYDYDICYHLAWVGTYGDFRNNTDIQIKNIQYTVAMTEMAARLGCKRFIGVGSQAEYGRYEGRLNGSTRTIPDTGYGMAKLCAGQMSRLRCKQLGIEHVWTRVLSSYGPGDLEQTMIVSLIRQLLSGTRPSCTKGEQIWDYIYSKDVARALYLLGVMPGKGQEDVYCIGSGMARPLAEYICEVRDIIAPEAEIGFGEIPYSDKQIMHLEADITALMHDTGFVPVYSFEAGIRETLMWVQKCDQKVERN